MTAFYVSDDDPYGIACEEEPSFLIYTNHNIIKNTVKILIEKGNYLGLDGYEDTLYFVESDHTFENFLKSCAEWTDLERGEHFSFSERIWEGQIAGNIISGGAKIYEDANVIGFGYGEEDSITNQRITHSLMAKLTEQTESTATFLVTDANGAFADRVGETFTLTKVTEP